MSPLKSCKFSIEDQNFDLSVSESACACVSNKFCVENTIKLFLFKLLETQIQDRCIESSQVGIEGATTFDRRP